MTDANKTEIVIVLDRSGSMQSIREAAVSGFNTFLREQQEVPGEATMTLAQFDDEYELMYRNVPLAAIKPLDQTTFVPRGSTALLDAIGRTIRGVGDRLASIPESSRPGKVVFVIITDGQENASKEFKSDQVMQMIRHQESKYSWQFVYIGANQDAIASAAALGIAAGNSLNFSANANGTQDAFKTLSTSNAVYRTSLRPGTTAKYFDADSSSAAPTSPGDKK